jgi:hypothetical protein
MYHNVGDLFVFRCLFVTSTPAKLLPARAAFAATTRAYPRTSLFQHIRLPASQSRLFPSKNAPTMHTSAFHCPSRLRHSTVSYKYPVRSCTMPSTNTIIDSVTLVRPGGSLLLFHRHRRSVPKIFPAPECIERRNVQASKLHNTCTKVFVLFPA